jgi:putative transposase
MRIAKSPAEFGFNRDDEPRLKRALKQAVDKRAFQRVQAVLLVAQGRTISEVAEISGVSAKTVYNWVNLYLDHRQVAALCDAPRSGRPPVAKRITPARILRELRRNPLRIGYRTTVWTVKLLAKHLGQVYQCAISPRTLRRRMRQSGLRCKRPRYFYEEKDPHRAQKKGRLSGS